MVRCKSRTAPSKMSCVRVTSSFALFKLAWALSRPFVSSSRPLALLSESFSAKSQSFLAASDPPFFAAPADASFTTAKNRFGFRLKPTTSPQAMARVTAWCASWLTPTLRLSEFRQRQIGLNFQDCRASFFLAFAAILSVLQHAVFAVFKSLHLAFCARCCFSPLNSGYSFTL